MQVEDKPVASSETRIHRPFDRRAAIDPAGRWHIDGNFRAIGCINTEPADDVPAARSTAAALAACPKQMVAMSGLMYCIVS